MTAASELLARPPAKSPGKAGKPVLVRRVGDGAWRRFETQVAAVDAFPGLSCAILSNILNGHHTSKHFEAKRAASPDTVIDLTDSPKLLAAAGAEALARVLKK